MKFVSSVKSVALASAYRIEGQSLVVLQVNCRTVYSKALEFWNLVDTYNPHVVIGTESWIKDTGNAEAFRADFTLSEGIGLPMVCVRGEGQF